ncbi:MAG TPA: response regulator, partial [Candidatus Acidoferrum sp.]|nr:response regulator [Candidatus Acidoferrum sp.]
DVKPDLVLADVFMPVRNGYEVCKYVKDDAALSHIPVILLVGAFDPLDEQEAQRVGADGVLKKPFVPPDPLISMVKSALARAGVSLGPKEPEPEPVKPAPFKPLALQMPSPAPVEEAPLEEIPVRPAPISIDRGGAQPLAFGSLLETPADEEQDAAELVSPARIERDWKSASEEEEMDVEEEAEESGPSWRPGGTDLEEDSTPAGKKDWREAAFENIPAAPSKPAYSIAEEEEPAAELVGAEQNSIPAPSAYASGNSWSAPKPEATQSLPAPDSIVMPDLISVTPVQENVPVVAPAPPAPVVAEVPPSTNGSWMSVPPSPWDAEVAKASKLVATWGNSVAVATEPASHSIPDPTPEQVAAALPSSAVEEIREEAAHVVEEAAPVAPAISQPAEVAAPAANVDDMVAKVLAKMDPAMLQSLTRELLKPVIESIVRDELNKK